MLGLVCQELSGKRPCLKEAFRATVGGMGSADFAQVADACGLCVEVICLKRREWAQLDHVSEMTGLPYCEIIRQLLEAHLNGEGGLPAIGSLPLRCDPEGFR